MKPLQFPKKRITLYFFRIDHILQAIDKIVTSYYPQKYLVCKCLKLQERKYETQIIIVCSHAFFNKRHHRAKKQNSKFKSTHSK